MGLITWVAIGAIVLVVIGLGWGIFFSGLTKGAEKVSENPLIQNATQEAAKAIDNNADQTTVSSTNTVAVVQTQKTVYKTAEPVVIVIKNEGDKKLTFPESSAILKIKNEDNGKNYDVVITQIKTNLEPGETLTITWDQQDNSGMAVSSGTYVADIETTNSTSVGQTTFTIEG
jgi:hypothetical protein